MEILETRTTCRSCGASSLPIVLDLGRVPVADRLLRKEQLAEPETLLPLTVVFCEACGLVQLRETVAPAFLFGDEYPYFSSVSSALLDHAGEHARDLIERSGLDSDSFVVEIASNDGYLLRNFVERSIPCLGIDPAPAPVRAARERGVPTWNEFFDRAVAERVVRTAGHADVVVANNVLAHVADLNGFVDGIAALLAESGVASIEVPYVADLVDHVEFDTIYHQHLCYFSVGSLDQLFAAHGLVLRAVRALSIHGGSLRLEVGREAGDRAEVNAWIERERQRGLDGLGFYADFSRRVAALRQDLRDLLSQLKSAGGRVVGYGAAAKAATLLGFAGIGGETLDYVVDRNPFKHGRFLGGNHLAIRPVEDLEADRPEVVLILAWNFADEILAQLDGLRRSGTRFILPIPEVRVIE